MLRAPLLLLVAACTPVPLGTDTAGGDSAADTADTGGDDTADTGDTGGDTGPGGCSGAAPTVDDLTAADGPVIEGDDGQVPSVLFTVQFSDADGDANVVSVRAWVDTTIDGSVDVSGDPVSEAGPVEMELEGEPVPDCEGHGGALSFALGVNGREIAYDTPTEFAVEVGDKAGLWSAAAVVSTTTPSELK